MPFGARLSVAGDRAVVVIAAKRETTDPGKGPMVIQAWQRRADGKRAGPQELAREEQGAQAWDRRHVGGGGEWEEHLHALLYARIMRTNQGITRGTGWDLRLHRLRKVAT